MDRRANDSVKDIACQQILLQDSSVFSLQWLVVPERYARLVNSELLLDRYLELVRDFTFSLIRPVVTAGGVQFRLLNTSLALLSFGPPQFQAGEGDEAVHLHINGGILVQDRECGRGTFSLSTEREPDGVRIAVQLADYCPLLLGSAHPSALRRMLYKLTQAYIHKRVTVRYLAELYRELTGSQANVRLVRVKVREGTET